jgi:ABC-three component (ABC-3C) system Middle Component 3
VKTWELRPIEVAHLLNPAFCGEVLCCAVRKYNDQSDEAFPFSLSFLVLPIVLHQSTRARILPNTREQMHVWLQANQDVRIGFAERARRLVPYTKETLSFLAQVDAIQIDKNAGIILLRGAKRRTTPQTDDEVSDCYKKSGIVGRWFARAGNPANVYTMWGVKP